jgi:transposase
MTKAAGLGGLDVHARQTHAAVLAVFYLDSGGSSVSRLRMAPEEVVSLVEGCPGWWRRCMRPGRPGFELARQARARGIDVRVVAPGSIPKGSGDRVKTDRRDAIRLVSRRVLDEILWPVE